MRHIRWGGAVRCLEPFGLALGGHGDGTAAGAAGATSSLALDTILVVLACEEVFALADLFGAIFGAVGGGFTFFTTAIPAAWGEPFL